MTDSELRYTVLQCIGNNVLFDAALSAIGATLWREAAARSPILSDRQRYVTHQVDADAIHVVSMRLGKVGWHGLDRRLPEFMLALTEVGEALVTDHKILINTVRLGFALDECGNITPSLIALETDCNDRG